MAIISFFNSNNFVDKDPGGGGGEGGFPKSFSIKRDRERTKAELLLGGLNDAQLSLSVLYNRRSKSPERRATTSVALDWQKETGMKIPPLRPLITFIDAIS